MSEAQAYITQKYGVKNPEAYASHRIRQTRMKTQAPRTSPASVRFTGRTSAPPRASGGKPMPSLVY